MRSVDPRLLRLAAPAQRYLTLTVALGLATAGLVIVQAWLIATVVARALLDGAGLDELGAPLAVLLIVVLARAGLAGAQETAGHRAGARVKAHLREAVLRRSTRSGAQLPGNTGGRAALMTRGIDALDGYFARFLPQLVLACIVPVVVLVQIAVIDWVSGLLIAITLPLIPVFMVLVGMHTRAKTARQWRTLSVLAGHFLDVVAGLPTLKVFGRARAQAARIAHVSDEHRSATARVLRVAFLSALVLELAATLSVAVVAVSVGLRLLEGRLDLRTALIVLILAPEAYLPIRNVGATFHASTEGLAAADQVFAVLEAPLTQQGSSRAVPDLSTAPLMLAGVAVRRPDGAADRLPSTSLVVAPGELLAVTGRTGAGKSTLLGLLLASFAPDAGTIGVGDVDLATLDPAAWRQEVAWLPQRPLLFAGTVADNVRLGEPDATDDEVALALHQASADFVPGLPGGLQALLGEHGAGLSAGQRQRVGLARVLLRVTRHDCGLVLLDEPTAHLDSATEARVVAAMVRALASRTTVVATHRIAVAAVAHRVHGLTGEPAAVEVGA
ncbi:MAG: thiol reductant ABC exporter subunit CydD [Actinomycetota bacterium]|nr:thiol reductant ABC exporter subunit CydD [Actinomycetota bacterium]